MSFKRSEKRKVNVIVVFEGKGGIIYRGRGVERFRWCLIPQTVTPILIIMNKNLKLKTFSVSSIISYFMLKPCMGMFKNGYEDSKIENNFLLVQT